MFEKISTYLFSSPNYCCRIIIGVNDFVNVFIAFLLEKIFSCSVKLAHLSFLLTADSGLIDLVALFLHEGSSAGSRKDGGASQFLGCGGWSAVRGHFEEGASLLSNRIGLRLANRDATRGGEHGISAVEDGEEGDTFTDHFERKG